jgi:hypothetical protein
MFQFGDRVLTRKGTQGLVVRQLAAHAPYYYLVAAVDGTALVAFQDELKAATGSAQGLFSGQAWSGLEQREGERRQGERRHGAHERAEKLPDHRSGSDRRHAERRQYAQR